MRVIEIAELLDACKQHAHQIADEPGFPDPVAEDARGLADRQSRRFGAGG